MRESVAGVAAYASELLSEAADPARAGPMAAYMKTDMPFYGVSSEPRKTIARRIVTEFRPGCRADYEFGVRALWRGEYREDKYLAVAYARSFPRYVTLSSVPLYRMMVTQGAWWDFVDEIAAHLVGAVLLKQRERFTPRVDAWSTSHDMWLRRTSILSQLRHKEETDIDLLAHACSRNLADTEFFIRKAIGWALREYAKTNPDWVIDYVKRYGQELSALSYREATKHLAV